MAAFLSTFARYPDWEETDWTGWMEAVGLLGFADLRPLALELFQTGEVSEDIYDMGWLDETLVTTIKTPKDPMPFERCYLGYIDDPIRALSWIDASYQPNATPIDAWRNVGRNDPCPCGSGRKFKKCCIGLD